MSHQLTGLAMVLAAASGSLLAGCLGWRAGRECGHGEGRDEGRDEGRATGRDEGFADGYAEGHADGLRIGRAGALMKAQAALDALIQPEEAAP